MRRSILKMGAALLASAACGTVGCKSTSSGGTERITDGSGGTDNTGGGAGADGSDASAASDGSGGTLGSAGANGDADSGSDGSGGSGGSDTSGTGGEAGATATGNDGPFEHASNLPEDFEVSVEDDFLLNGETCGSRAVIDTDQGLIHCYDPTTNSRMPYYVFEVVTQSDGSELAVFAGRNIEIETAVQVEVEGTRPLALLATESVAIRGSLSAIPDSDVANGGGFNGPSDSSQRGLGPGGGGPKGSSIGAGGGAYCGAGGPGGMYDGGSVGAGGTPWGTPEIIPLIGGSSGGSSYDGGGGGGAIQISAGASIQVTATGVIHVGGGEGYWLSGGGGSGGAILLEAPEVSVAGVLAANGGGGGGGGTGDSGTAASPDAFFAPGGDGNSGDDGGPGAAAEEVDGGAGLVGDNDNGGGGGGGAGRIRINTENGAATITGVVSPAVGTDCVTEGRLVSKGA